MILKNSYGEYRTLCEVCLSGSLAEHPKNPGYMYCSRCHSFYAPDKGVDTEKLVSISAKNLINNFQGYDDSRIGSNRWLSYFIGVIKSDTSSDNRNCLDIGCFNGALVHFMDNAGLDAYGLEMQNEMVEFCQHNGLRVYRGVMPFEIPKEIADKKFKLITAMETIYYWEELDRCVETIYDLLDENGYFLINLNQGTSHFYGNHPINERTRDFTIMLNVGALDILMKRHNFRKINHKVIAYIFDCRLFKKKDGLRFKYYRLRAKMLSGLLYGFNMVEKWDKIAILYQKS